MNATTTILPLQRIDDYVERFNALDPEDVVNDIPDADAADWMRQNIPRFECPDPQLESVYYYRWWTFRKHIKSTPAGRIVTEFISPVRHAGYYNSISCAAAMHIWEGRWLRDQSFLDEYIRFWFRADNGKPEPKFHHYSSWFAAALLDRSAVTGDRTLPLEMLDELIADYRMWETERQLPSGLFWQYDVRDGMEESITGSRKHKNARPTISSYMFANALAISTFCEWAGRPDDAATFREKAETLRALVQEQLWDESNQFFKPQRDEAALSDAREAIDFVPWCFCLPDEGKEIAWKQLTDPQGFWAPRGLTTAERRHPQFRSHGVGKCEWDGASWPFATSQTLVALANVLRRYRQPYVTRRDYFEAMRIYAAAHQRNGKPYIGEYYDEVTGEWLKGDNPRSRWYNHSTYCDLIISGLVGVVPSVETSVQIDPLLPNDVWDYFCLEDVPYHQQLLTVLWDRSGQRYGRGAGLHAWLDGQPIALGKTAFAGAI